jgi:carbonic anhydrase/acetyltransferase-like protein (isoleucine patch superfamily)
MKAVVMNGARIGRGSLVAVGSIVTEGTQIPPGSLAIGQPAKVKRQLTEHDQARIRHAAEHYVDAGRVYREARAGEGESGRGGEEAR